MQVGLKEKVFEICKLLLQQQKATIVTLRELEDKVRDLKEDFLTVMQRKRPYVTREQLETVFHENKSASIANVLQKLEEKKKDIAANYFAQ